MGANSYRPVIWPGLISRPIIDFERVTNKHLLGDFFSDNGLMAETARNDANPTDHSRRCRQRFSNVAHRPMLATVSGVKIDVCQTKRYVQARLANGLILTYERLSAVFTFLVFQFDMRPAFSTHILSNACSAFAVELSAA